MAPAPACAESPCQSHPPADLTAQLAAWHAQGGHRLEPVRFALVEALARRAADHQGVVRQVLDARLQTLVSDLRVRLAGRLAAEASRAEAGPAISLRGRLGQLADQLAGVAEPIDAASGPQGAAPAPAAAAMASSGRGARSSARQRAAAAASDVPAITVLESPPQVLPSMAGSGSVGPVSLELAAVRRFRGTWSRLSAEERLRQTLAQVPPQAGPLNALHLLHRALVGMHGISPEYLQHFVAQVDALLWLEQVQAASLPSSSVARAKARGKAVVRKR